MPAPDSLNRDLERWMERLVTVYRATRRTKGPASRLTSEELHTVARGVRRLSAGLMRGRRLVGARYMDDPELLAAYLLYFWPVSYAQAREVFGELGARPRSVLDLGSGPGPMSMAAFDAGAREVMAADRSVPALELAGRLARQARVPLQRREWDPLTSDELPGEKIGWNAIVLGHALNELWSRDEDRLERRVALCERLFAMLRKGGSLVLIEPALKQTTRGLLELRDRLVSRGHAVRAPCLFRGPCPALEREADWCHAERAWTPPPTLASIISASGLHREALKMSYVVLTPAGEAWPEPPPGRLFRIVSEHLRGHGRTRAVGCGPEGRRTLAVADDVRSKAARTFVTSRRGDVLRLEDARDSEEGGVRIEAATMVERVRRAGEAT